MNQLKSRSEKVSVKCCWACLLYSGLGEKLYWSIVTSYSGKYRYYCQMDRDTMTRAISKKRFKDRESCYSFICEMNKRISESNRDAAETDVKSEFVRFRRNGEILEQFLLPGTPDRTFPNKPLVPSKNQTAFIDLMDGFQQVEAHPAFEFSS